MRESKRDQSVINETPTIIGQNVTPIRDHEDDSHMISKVEMMAENSAEKERPKRAVQTI